MQNLINQISRFFLGSLLIFSGLIKLNDPVGTQIKLEEYFEVFAIDFGSFFHFLIPYSLIIGMLIIVLELTLGVAILIYFRMCLTTWVLLLLMVFFSFLTFYSAYFNKVTDCGCFGDAIQISPWQSFGKDIVIMVFTLHLFYYRRKYNSVLSALNGHIVIVCTVLISTLIGVYVINHLPIFDFRAYKVGNNIPQQMQAPEKAKIEYVFEKDGQEIKSLKYLSVDEGYKYKSSRIMNENRIKPKISDYYVTSPDGEDITNTTFRGLQLLVIIGEVGKSSTHNIGAIRKLIFDFKDTVNCLVLTSSNKQDIEAFITDNQLDANYAFVDATVLKTIVRSNPGITLWKDGTVLGKWHYRDTPTSEQIFSLVNKR